MAFLNETGLATFLSYLKAWARATFASKTDTQTIEGATTFSQTVTGSISGNAGTATKLQTARSLKTKLDSTAAVTFDGSAAQNAIPVTGVLPVANGGTGSSTQNFVDLSNNQTVGGVKFYTNNALFKHGLAKGTVPSSTSYKSIVFLDNTATPSSYSSSNTFGQIRSVVSSNGASFIDLMGFKNEASATANSRLTVGYDTNGIAFATAPATSSSRTTSTDIVTRGYLGFTPIAGAVTGTASSTVWRSCVVGRTDSGSSNPWYKVATRLANGASSSYNITFYVENASTSYKHFGILRVSVSTNSSKIISSASTKFAWLVNDGFNLEDFVLVCPATAEPTVELWTKLATGYLRRRFVVISEGYAGSTSTIWTLLDASSAGQSASITTEGTQIVSSASSLEQRVKALEEAMR